MLLARVTPLALRLSLVSIMIGQRVSCYKELAGTPPPPVRFKGPLVMIAVTINDGAIDGAKA